MLTGVSPPVHEACSIERCCSHRAVEITPMERQWLKCSRCWVSLNSSGLVLAPVFAHRHGKAAGARPDRPSVGGLGPPVHRQPSLDMMWRGVRTWRWCGRLASLAPAMYSVDVALGVAIRHRTHPRRSTTFGQEGAVGIVKRAVIFMWLKAEHRRPRVRRTGNTRSRAQLEHLGGGQLF